MSTHWKNFITKSEADRQWLVQVNTHGQCVVYRIDKDGNLGSFASSNAQEFCTEVMASVHEAFIVRDLHVAPWVLPGSKHRWRDVVGFLNKKGSSRSHGAIEEILRISHGLEDYVSWNGSQYEIGKKGLEWDRKRDAALQSAEQE